MGPDGANTQEALEIAEAGKLFLGQVRCETGYGTTALCEAGEDYQSAVAGKSVV